MSKLLLMIWSITVVFCTINSFFFISKYSDIVVEPATKALHLTLAYQFSTEHYNVLNELAKTIDTNAVASWELRLYSRDSRIRGNEVFKESRIS